MNRTINVLARLRAAVTLSTLTLLIFGVSAQAQDQPTTDGEEPSEIEEVVVVGTQIKGVDVSGLLPVSVFDADDIAALGVDSGDELFQMMPSQGQNFFNEEENISGGVNSARGDVGAFNLRNLGTGNTLVLLNGRRMVNAASYQTEEVGGSFIPVNTVNSNTIPVFGVERVEILKDGAAAVYGADAVAGVVNTVLKTDMEGMVGRIKFSDYSNVGRNTRQFNGEWGGYLNNQRTHVGVMFDHYSRDAINSQEDERWADADFRRRIPEDSPWSGSTSFRNTSAHSLFGQFDIVRSVSRFGLRGITDTRGEFETYPMGEDRCQWQLNETTCAGVDGQGTYRYNLNEFRDLSSKLARTNLFVFLNHNHLNGNESFGELLFYRAATTLSRHPSYSFSTVKLRVGPENYYNPFGPCGSPNRLPADFIPDVPCEGLMLEVDFYRYAEHPRIIENDGNVYRMLYGLRGIHGKWDWETAALWSKATRSDVTKNRVSNTLMAEALFDSTPAAYNPFSGGQNSNIERALIDVYRDNETSLFLVDAKMSTVDLFDLPAGPVSALAGAEFRREAFVDDRDPRLDGTIVFTDYQGDTYPYVSDVVNSSPTGDSDGERGVFSLFGELQIPVLQRLDSQVALRYENFSDVGDTIVGKVALGYSPISQLQFRGSWSQGFRVPNLVTVNESVVARQNTRQDWTCTYASLAGGDPDQNTVDCVNSTQRVAEGSENLVAEESDNISLGVVLFPDAPVTATVDRWSIVKDGTIGLLGEENHTVYDLLLRLQAGSSNCSSVSGNPAVVRASEVADDVSEVYLAAGLCPAGDIHQIRDTYANLDTRNLQGLDFAIYTKTLEDWFGGRFNFKYQISILTHFKQEAGGVAGELVQASQNRVLPASIPVSGFADLVERDGNQKTKSYMYARWRMGGFGVSYSQSNLGSFYQNSLTLDDGTRYEIPSMATHNLTLDYSHDTSYGKLRYRLGVRNITNERAPLADRYFGFFADAHRDYGKIMYFDFRLTQK